MENGGDFVLTGANQVNNLAANLSGNLEFNNSQSLVISNLTYESDCGTSEVIAKMSIDGDLDLTIDGALNQTVAICVAGDVTLIVSDDVCLLDPLNDFSGTFNASGTTVEVVDSNGLTAGVIASVNDVFLQAGAGGSGTLNLSDNITTTDAAGQVLLQAASGVTQTGGIITTNVLMLGGDSATESSGNFVLNSNNEVNALATNLRNDLLFTNVGDVFVVKADHESDCDSDMLPDEVFAGVIVGGNITLNITGSLLQNTSGSSLPAVSYTHLTLPTKRIV